MKLKDSGINVVTWNRQMLIDELAEQYKDVIERDLIASILISLEKNIENHLLDTQVDNPVNIKIFSGLTITGRIKPQRKVTVAGTDFKVNEGLKVTAKISRYFSKKLDQYWMPYQNRKKFKSRNKYFF